MENNFNEDNEFEKKLEVIKDESIDFLKNIGISEVSNRTFIHEDELRRFLDGDFTNINKAKAMGFIQILQREYRLDLSGLRNRYLSYIEEHKSDEIQPQESIMMEEVRSEARTKKFFTLFFLLLAIGSIAYLIKKYDLLKFDSTDIINTVQMPQTEQNIQIPKVEQKVDKSIKKEEKQNIININDVLSKNTQQSHENENNQNENNLLNSSDVENSNNKINNNDSTKNEDLDLSQLNSDLAKNDTESIDDTNENLESSDDTTENNDVNNTDAVQNELYIIPDSKVWIGTIDLETFKKKDFLAKKGIRVDIDTSTNKLIMIGHKFIKIYFNGELVSFKRRGPIRFKYIDGQLEEINRREFNRLSKGRHW